jgi:UDP-N-acetylglucosamine/UDP-N-acetylgalactosamine diphosphorylase
MVAVGLPLHRAHKRIPYCDAQGETVFPDEPNAYKFE